MNAGADPRAPLVALVDDEQDITTGLGMALEDAGYRVVTTNQPGGALALLRRARPDLVCLDLLMPGCMGTSLYLALRCEPRLAGIPVLIFSGLEGRQELRRILAERGEVAAPEGFVDKPVEAEAFVAQVREALARAGGARPAPREPEAAP